MTERSTRVRLIQSPTGMVHEIRTMRGRYDLPSTWCGFVVETRLGWGITGRREAGCRNCLKKLEAAGILERRRRDRERASRLRGAA